MEHNYSNFIIELEFLMKLFSKNDTFEALNEKTTTERESLTSQLSESNQVRSELQLHITQLEQQYKEVIFKGRLQP